MEKKRLCKGSCGQEIKYIRNRPRCYICYQEFIRKRVAGFKLEKDE